MTTRYLIPATVAASAHALLFFPAPDREPATSPKKSPTEIVITHAIVLPSEPPSVDLDEIASTPMPRGSTLERPPVSEDHSAPSDAGFVIDRQRPLPGSRPLVSTPFIPGTFGVPNGDEESVRLNGPRILDASQLDSTPRARSQMPPKYPAEAAREGRSGEVWVEFVVIEDGTVRNPRVIRATDSVFVEATLRAIERWRFEPGRRDGRVVRFRMAVPVVFEPAGREL